MKLMKNIDGSKRFIGFENSNKFTEKIRTQQDKRFSNAIFDSAKGYSTMQEALSAGRQIAIDLEKMEYKI